MTWFLDMVAFLLAYVLGLVLALVLGFGYLWITQRGQIEPFVEILCNGVIYLTIWECARRFERSSLRLALHARWEGKR